jgi:phage terminase small subunit
VARPKQRTLNPRQLAFIKHYLGGMTGLEATRAAGYGATGARTRASEMLHKNELTMRAIAEGQAKLRADINYNAETAQQDLTDKIALAIEARQYSAVAKLTELKMRLAGLLDKEKAVGNANLQINIGGLGPAAPQVDIYG